MDVTHALETTQVKSSPSSH